RPHADRERRLVREEEGRVVARRGCRILAPGEMIGHQLRGAKLTIGQLGVLVDVAPPRKDAGQDPRGAAVDFLCEPRRRGLGRGRERRGDEHQRQERTAGHRECFHWPPDRRASTRSWTPREKSLSPVTRSPSRTKVTR